jgi:uncharacterized repeat protein (TIGR02543 family)
MSLGLKSDSLSLSQVSKRFLVALMLMFTLLSTEKSSVSAATAIFYEPFTQGWTAGSTWSLATGANYTAQIWTEAAQTPQYALRLTSTATSRSGGLIYNRPIPTSSGLDVSFTFSMWGGTGADGMNFFLQKGTETSSVLPPGGTLGYSADRHSAGQANGLRNGLLGIGLDMYGNHSLPTFSGTGCPTTPVRTETPNALVIRGPGSLKAGYCILASLKNTKTNWASGASHTSSTRSNRAKAIRIIVDPSTVTTPQVKIWICAANTTCSTAGAPDLAVNAPAALLNEPTVRFGFSAASGGLTNRHEVWNLAVDSQAVFPPVVITTQTLPNGSTTAAYTASVAANGIAPYTFAVTSGTLPQGLSLNALTGEISGTPTTAGTYSFTVETTDSRVVGEVGRTATQPYTVTIGGVLCTVTYDEAGGSAVANTDFFQPGTITLPAAPTRAGYSFLGWFTSATGGSALTSPHTPAGCNVELIARWALIYNVTYEERGGTTVTDATFISGGTVTLPAAPTRAGFTFQGWFTAPDGGTQYGSTTTPPDGNVSIYAQWLPYTVTYDERGGTTVSDTTFNCVTTCDTITLPPTPTRAGYVFEGWYTAPTGGTRYGATYVPTAKDQVIYAQWTPYEVSFQTQGGTPVAGWIIGSNATITLPPAPSRAGFNFNGWFTTPTGGSPVGATYGPHTGDIDFFAQWSPVLHNVTYEEHGGTTVPDATFVSGGTVTLPAKPTRAGYTFDGWFTAQTGGTEYGSTSTPPDGNLVVHAQWTRDPFTVTYQEYGGTTVSDSEFVSGGTVTLPANPTRAGYTFDGWFTAQTGGTKYGSTSTPPDGNLVVHAQWTQISANTVFSVTYQEHGGTTVADATFVSGGTVTLPADPTRAGYTFDGWFTEETDGTKYNSTFSPTDENVVVHAQWTQIPFSVTFEEHGGTTVPNETFVSGGSVTLPADPTRAGYTFNGWFTAQTGGTKYNSSFSPADGNLVVHAQWTQIPSNSFAVTFEEHGGTTVSDATFVSGGSVTLPADPTRAGYTFNGWFSAQTGGTKFNSSFSPSDGNLVVHAQWTQNPFTVTFEEHGGSTVSDATFVSGGTVTLPADPTRAGYTFNGWFSAQTGGTKFNSSFSPSDGNLVVHAQWTPVTVATTPAKATAASAPTSSSPVLPTTGNDVESFLLLAIVLMLIGFFTANPRRTKTN